MANIIFSIRYLICLTETVRECSGQRVSSHVVYKSSGVVKRALACLGRSPRLKIMAQCETAVPLHRADEPADILFLDF
jgi:hypothetical protein